MRTLNRPMFRYGGPIKEGVMHGIREPRRNGGSMGEPQMLNTVGSPYAPSSGGRSNYGFNPLNLFKAKNAANVAKVGTGGQTSGIITQKIKNLYNAIKGKPIPKYAKDRKSYFDKIPWQERAGMYVRNNPLQTGALAVGATSDPAIGTVKAVGGGLKGIADFLTPGWIQRKFAEDEGKKLEKDEKDEKELTANEIEIKRLNKLLEQPEVPVKSADEIRNERIQKYREIMDIKGMDKEAAYDSLISASQAINESGDFKGDIKSGKLMNKIIQGASKAFDKPKATKDAIDTLILKGEIESDIAAGKPSTYLKAAQDMVATGASKNIQEAMKTLTKSENSMSSTLGAILAKGNRLDEKTVGVAYREETGNIPTGVIKLTEVNEWLEDNEGKNELDYTKKLLDGQDLAPGDYIIGERVVTIDEDKTVSFFY